MKFLHTTFSPEKFSWEFDAPIFNPNLKNQVSNLWRNYLSWRPTYAHGVADAASQCVQSVGSDKPGVIHATVAIPRQKQTYNVFIKFHTASITSFIDLLHEGINSLDQLEFLTSGDCLFIDTTLRAHTNLDLTPLSQPYKIEAACSCGHRDANFCRHMTAVYSVLIQGISDNFLHYFAYCGMPLPLVEKAIQERRAQILQELAKTNKVDAAFHANFWGNLTKVSAMEKKLTPPSTDAAAFLKRGKIPIMLNKKNSDIFFQELYYTIGSQALKSLESNICAK